MKRIVLCLDGTWNQVEKGKLPTNVVRIAQSVAERGDDGTPQIVYYNAGVGTDGPVDRFLGGVFGVGLRRNVQRAYAFCALNYRDGDEIYIFGFSRGAYTARAVAGIISRVGLVRPAFFDRFDEVWSSYRSKKDKAADDVPLAEIDRLADRTVPVRCLGVWDTVGSYGIPSGFGFGGLARLFTRRTLRFRDTSLSKNVEAAFHAIAVDERRRPFAPTFWTKKKTRSLNGQICEQVWFMGAHSNVGGSYEDHALSDIALIWMMARVEETTRLRFNIAALEGKVAPNISALPENSTAWFYIVSRLRPLHRKMMNQCATDVGLFWDKRDEGRENINERVHWSVINRYSATAQPFYRPKGFPADCKEEWHAKVSGRERQLWAEFGTALSD